MVQRIMLNLSDYLKEQSSDSSFKAEYISNCGYVTFSNSGKRGSTKYFQIGLQSILATLQDISNHLDIFEKMKEYNETIWRDNGHKYFSDEVANANSTVQTKPLFSTLSKIIKWANQPDLESTNSDQYIEISSRTLERAINKITKLINIDLDNVIKINDEPDSISEDELVNKLKAIEDEDSNKFAKLILFGIKYGKFITNAQELNKKASIRSVSALPAGVAVRNLIASNNMGVGFYKPDASYLAPINPQNKPVKSNFLPYLPAMRTKPFLLLAGISGTGKSRIVREMAFAACPKKLQDANNVSPGNYCMIEVKPNWHDSTELMGYASQIGKPHYVVTPFINFIIKAWHHIDTPFFVCLDEMNLAPAEQYFAEYLSVLESRKLNQGKIVSEPLIKPEYTQKYIEDFKASSSVFNVDNVKSTNIFEDIAKNGLRLPPNLIVIGTINMDETTYQFSRKVIDRAMTIEMSHVDFDAMFTDTDYSLQYTDSPMDTEFFLPKYASAREVLTQLNDVDQNLLKVQIPELLKRLDNILQSTPFRVAYRVQNELILYYAALREVLPNEDGLSILQTSFDDILMMKVLPRIEGNEESLEQPLKALVDFSMDKYPRTLTKIKEMQARLEINRFASFWP